MKTNNAINVFEKMYQKSKGTSIMKNAKFNQCFLFCFLRGLDERDMFETNEERREFHYASTSLLRYTIKSVNIKTYHQIHLIETLRHNLGRLATYLYNKHRISRIFIYMNYGKYKN